MKKIFYSISVLLIAVSCSVQERDEWIQEPVRFSASGISTRTAFSADGDKLNVVWAKDDTIGIWSSSSNRGNYPYTAAVNRNDATSAQFSMVSEDMMFLYDGSACTYYAYYPWRSGVSATPVVHTSLPSSQVQARAGDASHLVPLNLFRAAPVSVSGSSAQADFSFRPAYSILHFALGLDPAETINVPIRRIKLSSEGAPLAAESISLDLSDDASLPVVTGPSGEVSLSFGTMPELSVAAASDAWLTVLPGAHAAPLVAEITAIDGSVASVNLPAASFAPGKSYSRNVALKVSDFAQAVPFDITAPSLTVNAGEAITFNIQGTASGIGFWSGETYHDYQYSDKDRVEFSNVYMSLRQALLSGGQGDCLDIKLSTDYDGTLTETAILESTWIDMTDDFNLDTSISGSGNPNSGSNYSKFKKSAEVAVSDYAGGKPFRIVLFWHALPDMGGRTVSWITGIKVWNDKEVLMNQENSKGTNPVLIEGASYGNDSSHCGWYDITANGAETTNCFRFFSTFTLTGTAQRHAYAVIDDEFQAESLNKGHDTPFTVQAPSADTPSSWSYTFEQPGTYTVVFEASCPTLSGPHTETRTFNITVL